MTLCKSLHVTDLVCDHAWELWKTVQESMEKVDVCVQIMSCTCIGQDAI